MAKIIGYEVTAQKPVCVDFLDGRVVSFRPGSRFEAHPTNTSVRRLLKVREVRQLGETETVPPLPVKLGAPKEVRSLIQARNRVAKAQQLSIARAKETKAKANAPEYIDLGAMNRPKRKKSSGRTPRFDDN